MAAQLRWVDLEHPVEVDGQLITSLSFRPPNCDDVARAREIGLQIKRGSANVRLLIQMTQILANTAPEVIQKLHLADLDKAAEAAFARLQAHTRPTR